MAETIASMAVRIGADISDFEKNMKEFRRTFGKLGQQVQEAGTKIGTAFTAAGGAIAVGLGIAVNKAMDFDAQMSRVGAISGATGSDLQALRQAALDLGASTSKSASEVAVGFELMAAKGYDAQQIIAAMPGVIAAAEASGEDMALVADTVASALNAFGLEASQASKVADVLAQSANTSAAGIDDLQYAFKYAAPVAKALGVSLEQLAAATGIMSDAGMRGEQAGTTLRAALLRLSDPPKEARAALENLGISVTDSSGKFKPLGAIIGEFSSKLQGMTNAQKVATLSQVFGTEAATGMLSVIEKGPAKFEELTKALQNSEGASKAAAAQMKDNLKGSLEELGGAVETAQISIGSALSPVLRGLADAIKGVVEWFNKLSPDTQKFIAISGAVATALLLVTGAVGFLVAGLGALAAAEWAVILPIAGIITGVTAAVAVIVALGVLIYKNWGNIKKFLSETWYSIKHTAATVWYSIKQIFWDSVESVKSTVVSMWGSIVSFFSAAPNQIAVKLTELKNTILSKWQEMKYDALDMGKNIIIGLWNGISSMAQWVKDKVYGFVSGIGQTIKDFFGIASPSKLMAEYGEYIGEGLAEGIRNKTGEVKSAAKDMAGAVEEQVNRTKQLIDSFKPGGANFGMSQEQIDRYRFGQSAAAGGNLDIVASDQGWKTVQGAVQAEYERLLDKARKSGSHEDIGIIMDKAKANVDAMLQNKPTRYHSGGLVTKLGPREVPAILEEGEVVLPRGARASGGQGQVVFNITGNTFYGERDLIDRVGPALIRYLAKAGVRA